jgi:hypothetical protein
VHVPVPGRTRARSSFPMALVIPFHSEVGLRPNLDVLGLSFPFYLSPSPCVSYRLLIGWHLGQQSGKLFLFSRAPNPFFHESQTSSPVNCDDVIGPCLMAFWGLPRLQGWKLVSDVLAFIHDVISLSKRWKKNYTTIR